MTRSIRKLSKGSKLFITERAQRASLEVRSHYENHNLSWKIQRKKSISGNEELDGK